MTIADARDAIARLAMSNAAQVECVSRQRIDPANLLLSSLHVIRVALADCGQVLSPVLRLRLEALAVHLEAMAAEPSVTRKEPQHLLQQGSWVELRNLAENALREAGWPPE